MIVCTDDELEVDEMVSFNEVDEDIVSKLSQSEDSDEMLSIICIDLDFMLVIFGTV